MRGILVALLAVLCAVSAFNVDTTHYAERQKDIYDLFKHLHQDSMLHKKHGEILSPQFHLHEHPEWFTKPEVLHHMHDFYTYDFYLKKGEIFSVFNEAHLKQAIGLFKLFYYAKDFDTFYKTAVYTREHFNEGMFLYAFSVALIHRPDTYYYALPPIYEIYPYYFFSTEVIHQAQYYKQMYNGHPDSHYNDVTIYSNFSGHYLNLHPEQSLSYFTEDVGINSFYYYYNLYYPFWMDGEEFHLKNDNRGEVFYYFYQQILARYYLERLSNGFGEIPYINWEVPFETGYYPSLVYSNGLEFPSRPHYANLHEYFYNYGQSWTTKGSYGFSYTRVHDYERRIRDAIDSGYVYTHKGEKHSLLSEEGINILGSLIESNPDSPYYKYYGAYQMFARHLLGYSTQPLDYHRLHPSALEHFETSLRDPAFWMLYKKLIFLFYRFQWNHVEPYTETDLYYHGVDVHKVEFDRLVTYFDYVTYDISNAVYVTPEEYEHTSFKVKVAQESLTHKPFTYKLYVKSEHEDDVVVHVYLGPKYDEYDRYINLTENYMNFVQFDHFHYKLKVGENTIVRNSHEMHNYMHDRSTYLELYQKALGVYQQNKEHTTFSYYGDQFYYGFPHNYYLPKGSHDGTPFQFYFFVSKAKAFPVHGEEYFVGNGRQYVDGYPFGYPFDRPIHFEYFFQHAPNGYFHEATIYHKEVHEINAPHHH